MSQAMTSSPPAKAGAHASGHNRYGDMAAQGWEFLLDLRDAVPDGHDDVEVDDRYPLFRVPKDAPV